MENQNFRGLGYRRGFLLSSELRNYVKREGGHESQKKRDYKIAVYHEPIKFSINYTIYTATADSWNCLQLTIGEQVVTPKR